MVDDGIVAVWGHYFYVSNMTHILGGGCKGNIILQVIWQNVSSSSQPMKDQGLHPWNSGLHNNPSVLRTRIDKSQLQIICNFLFQTWDGVIFLQEEMSHFEKCLISRNVIQIIISV